MNKISLLLIACVTFFTAGSCEKGGDEDNPGKATKNLPGTIYWYFGGNVGYQEFKGGKYVGEKMPMGVGSSRFDSFDISWDNQNILLSMDAEGTFNFDERRFVLRKNSDGIKYADLADNSNLFDIVYEWEDISTTNAFISPNGKYLALAAQHFSDLPVTIIDVEAEDAVSSWSMRGVSFLQYGSPVWTADNTVYFRIANDIFKSSLADGFQTAPHVLTLPSGSSYATVNPQGSKIVYRNNKHLWICNMDGSDPKQITTCKTLDIIDNDGEKSPVFSPDGKYIAFTGATSSGTPWSDHNYPDGSWVAATGGNYGYIVIIPADGNLYDLDNLNSGAIWLKESGGNNGIACSHRIVWR